MKKYELCIIGTGNMGEAVLSGVLKKKLFISTEISAIEIDSDKRKLIKKQYGITCSNNFSLIKSSKRLLLAVKPQNIDSLLKEIDKYLSRETLILSIAAGKTINDIKKNLTKELPIIRIMPNTPALVGLGVSGICFNDKVTSKQKKDAVKIFKSIGKVLIFSEDKMNNVTAVSGSGPAYVFYFAEALLESAESLGFSKKEAEELVYGTIEGALLLIKKTSSSPSLLREKVTSKGGTTEAALNILDKNKVKNIFKKAIHAAKNRGSQLSGS